MSLMIANVRERVTEIGLRRSLGARKIDIAGLFIGEGVLVSFMASVTGVVMSMLIVRLLAPRLEDFPLVTNSLTITLPLLAALFIGFVCTGWPAHVAASMAPAEALRND